MNAPHTQSSPNDSPSEASPWEPLLQKTEAYAREKPTQALSSAFGIGLVLALLPLGSLISGVFRVLFLLLRPILIVLGLVKLYEEFARSQSASGSSATADAPDPAERNP